MASLNKLPPTFVGTFIRQIKLLEIVGIKLFDESDTTFVRKYGRLLIFSIMLLFMFVGQILNIVKRKEVGANVLNVVRAIPSILVVVQDTIKMFVVVLKRNEIEQVILEIGKLWQVNNEYTKQNEEMRFRIRRLKFWNNALFCTWTLTIMVFTLVPLAVTIYGCYAENVAEYRFIIEMYFFKNLDSHFKYAIAIAFQIVMCTQLQMCLDVSCDCLLLNLSCDLAVLLRLVQIDLLSLKGTSDLANLQIYADENYQDIKSILKKHQILLSLTERLNNIFKEVLFSQVYLSSVVICCYLFTSTMSKYGVVSSLGDLVGSMDILAKTYFLAVPGQIIADLSSGVADAAYQSLWYERSYKFRKCIAIVIARAQKPSFLSALSFSNLTLVMFSKVASTSWSYLSLLNQMSENFDV